MTKKDYEKVAGVFHQMTGGLETPRDFALWSQAVVKMSMAFEQENPRFNARKFEQFCSTGSY